MLKVVTRVRLVRDGRQEVGGVEWQVGVDVDARPTTTIEPVVASPGLAGDKRDSKIFSVGQAEQRGRPFTTPRDEPGQGPRQPLDRNLELAVPRRQSGGQPAFTGEQLIDCRRRR